MVEEGTMKLAMLFTVAALAAAIAGAAGHAAVPGATRVEAGLGQTVVPAACVWKRVWIPRHVKPNGVVVRGHWSHHKRKVCS